MDQQVVNALKGLVIDGVEKARSGHPGGAMSSADLAYILYTEFLRFDPQDPEWLGRDRFILSAGHESMLLYSLLFASGWLKREDLQSFRQLHSLTPGHPENILTRGVECTTGPLGQGCAMSVGFAAAGAHLSAVFGTELFSHYTWSLLGDGCMQEDITYGAASLAGHLGLGHLIWIYDKNRAQISGSIDRAVSDCETQIYAGLGWEVLEIDGHDHGAIRQAYEQARTQTSKPTLIVAHTIMAKGAASLEGAHVTHGAPLSVEERCATKEKLGLDGSDRGQFFWSESLNSHFQRNFSQKAQVAAGWHQHYDQKMATDAPFAKRWRQHFEAPDVDGLPAFEWDTSKALATRGAFGKLIEAWAPALSQLLGGSADLEPSNMTGAFAKQVGDFQKNTPGGRNFAFGVREFPMSAMCNGLALHGGVIPFDATFLTFSDYSRPALRLGAIQKARVIHEFTHDSFYLGEDGPTHQPIEHIMSLRLIPDLYVMRPADGIETEVLLREALKLDLPSCLCLSRQNLPFLPVKPTTAQQAHKGAWFVVGSSRSDLVIYATGAEVHLALETAKLLEGSYCKSVAVVSVPCWELFFAQEASYIEEIMMPACQKRVSIEAATTLGWERFVGRTGLIIGIDHFGASAPASDLATEFGFIPEAIVTRIMEQKF